MGSMKIKYVYAIFACFNEWHMGMAVMANRESPFQEAACKLPFEISYMIPTPQH